MRVVLERGTVIDGKYEILKEIGRGGMSIVYLAMDNRLNKQWAVKVIQRKGIGKNNEIIINTVPDDTELMKRLDHPAIPRIVDIINNPNDPQIYIVMDYVEGESLDKVIAEFGAQPQELVIDWAKQVCDTLGYLHSQKPPIIYRDMKPANIMLKPEGNIKLIDFGIAREYKEQNLADTTTLGTKGYAPPEQFGSRQTDARSDIYALGMTMHHLLTAVDPRTKNYEYIPIRQYNAEFSSGLERIINKCTSLDPEDRYQNCNELMFALNHYKEEEDDYRKKQKKKLSMFIATVVVMIAMLIVGATGQILLKSDYNNQFENYMSQGSNDSKKYIDAMNVPGKEGETKPYFEYINKVLELNTKIDETDDTLTDMTNLFDVNKDELSKQDDYYELCYRIGYTYLSLYKRSKDDENSLRSASVSAKKYFEIIKNSKTDTEYKDIANSYYIICDYTIKYINSLTTNSASSDSQKFVKSIKSCCDNNLDGGKVKTDDYARSANYSKLNIYCSFINLINVQCETFKSNGISKSEIVDIVNQIKNNAENINTYSKSGIIKKQNEVISNCEYALSDNGAIYQAYHSERSE